MMQEGGEDVKKKIAEVYRLRIYVECITRHMKIKCRSQAEVNDISRYTKIERAEKVKDLPIQE